MKEVTVDNSLFLNTFERVLGSGSSSGNDNNNDNAVINLGRLRRFKGKLYQKLQKATRGLWVNNEYNLVKLTFDIQSNEMTSFAIRVCDTFGNEGVILYEYDGSQFRAYPITNTAPFSDWYAYEIEGDMSVYLVCGFERYYYFEPLIGPDFTITVGENVELPDGYSPTDSGTTSTRQYEVKTNKATSISSASTNAQYPSAAAVYNAISGITGLPSTTASDEGKVLKVVNTAWEKVMPATIYTGNSAPGNELGNNGDIYLSTVEVLRAPDVIYETDGTTGLLGHNQSSFANQWQLENLNLSPYKYIKCYFKCSTSTDSSAYTPAVVVTVPLDTAAMGSTAYFGGTMTPLPFNRNRYFLVSCAVDGTKTKFQVVHQNTIWDVTTSDANTLGRYCYKIEGWY